MPGVPGLPKSPLVFHVTRRSVSSHVYTDHLHPWIPAVPRETGMVGLPGLGSGLLGSWFPYFSLPTLLRKEALRTPRLAAFTPPIAAFPQDYPPQLPEPPDPHPKCPPSPTTITPQGWEQSALRDLQGIPWPAPSRIFGLEAGATS